MRGQLSVEAFLVLTFAAMALAWFSNYADVHGASANTVSVAQQSGAIAGNIAALADRAASTGSATDSDFTIDWALPCIWDRSSGVGQSVPYQVQGAVNAINLTVFGKQTAFMTTKSTINGTINGTTKCDAIAHIAYNASAEEVQLG